MFITGLYGYSLSLDSWYPFNSNLVFFISGVLVFGCLMLTWFGLSDKIETRVEGEPGLLSKEC